MNRFFIEELKVKCNEINNAEVCPEMISKVIEAYDCICSFASRGRNEGLLALEEAAEELDLSDDTKQVFFWQIMLVVDGTEPQLVKAIGANRCAAYNLPSYLGLINLMYVQGSLMIQAGDNLFVIEQMLKSMMPKSVLDELSRYECENALPKALKEAEEMVAALCKDDGDFDDNDHSIAAETAKALIGLSDMEIQRLLKETNNGTITVAMKGMNGKARKRILDNLSTRVAVMTAEDVTYMGPVRMADVEAECVKIARILINLCDSGEICDYDFSMLKEVADIFDSAEK